MIEKVLNVGRGEHRPKDVFDALTEGAMTLWVAPSRHNIAAMAITEIARYPQYRTCRVILGAGKLDLIVKNIEPIEDWARTRGCVAVEMNGRAGWERILTDWQKTHIVLRKDLQ